MLQAVYDSYSHRFGLFACIVCVHRARIQVKRSLELPLSSSSLPSYAINLGVGCIIDLSHRLSPQRQHYSSIRRARPELLGVVVDVPKPSSMAHLRLLLFGALRSGMEHLHAQAVS
jgi:hypothetical protein